MTGFIVLLILIGVAILGYKVWASTEVPPIEPPPSEAELLQARLDLHRIEVDVDLALAKQEISMQAEVTKQAIADALVDDER